jgi:hypothetical protein
MVCHFVSIIGPKSLLNLGLFGQRYQRQSQKFDDTHSLHKPMKQANLPSFEEGANNKLE